MQSSIPKFPNAEKKFAEIAPAKSKRRKKADAPKLCDSFRVAIEPITVRLALPPKLNHYYRVAVIGRHAQTYISQEGKEFREHVIREWREQAGRVTFEGRLAMHVEIVYRDKREGDMDGHLKALWDALEHAGAYRNDSQIRLLVLEQSRIESPGWVMVTLGPKHGAHDQKDLFSMNW